MFIARDKDGSLWLYDREPRLSPHGKYWPDLETRYMHLKGGLFNNITFDDGPVKVKIEIATENIK